MHNEGTWKKYWRRIWLGCGKEMLWAEVGGLDSVQLCVGSSCLSTESVRACVRTLWCGTGQGLFTGFNQA